MDVHLKNLFGRFHEQFGCGPGLGPGSGTCVMKVDGIAPKFIKSMYRAAAALYELIPGKGHVRGIFLVSGLATIQISDWSSKKQLFQCVQFIRGDGGDVGFHMFQSENDAKRMTVDVQWPQEWSKVYDLVAVTVTHPPGQAYEEKTSSTPTKYAELLKEEFFVDVKISLNGGLKQCAMCGLRDSWGGLDNGEKPSDSPFHDQPRDGISSPILLSGRSDRLDSYTIWGGALDLIKSIGAPAFFTDQSEISLANAKQVHPSAGLHITHPVTPNPFLSPVRTNGASSHLPSYKQWFCAWSKYIILKLGVRTVKLSV
ncbi:zinc finger MYND domain protein [Tripterygium wilfordii]|uniref:Zinc finger MYND domain protein n=1 Tax=Tripterygium wilfordii TaxID=458696 RepID=A0A7J7C4K5_TRIWF|nr:zinc finger MYND domain protein [Tripterygium wilfordii]